ncbi:ricin B lectin domain-containing protein [Mycena rebaudengoi]|nr:ricin B lectin domain-containing protein [Mycena rebaudengoi]
MFARNVTVSLLLAFSMISQVAGTGFKLQSVLNTAKCIAASSLTNGAPVVIQDCGTNATSLNTWFETPLPPDGFARLLSAGGVSSCLDVTDGPSGDVPDGTRLQMWACSPSDPAQEWIFEDALSAIEWGGGLAIKGSKGIDVTNGVTANGNQLQIWKCGGNNNHQRFKKIPV